METTNSSNKNSTVYLILAIVFFITSCILAFMLYNVKSELQVETKSKDVALNDKQELIQKLQDVSKKYEELSAENTAAKELFQAEKATTDSLIRVLKKSKADINYFRSKVANYEKKLNEYVKQITELKAKNEEITAENVRITNALDSTIHETKTLTEKNMELSDKVEVGATLKAYEITTGGIRVKSKGTEIPTQNPKRVDKIRTCFLISENPITPHGKKNAYVRIAAPGGKIFFKNETDLFKFNNKDIAYSVKQEIDYQGKAIDLCLYWDGKMDNLQKGTYEVDIFVESQQIGHSTFKLE